MCQTRHFVVERRFRDQNHVGLACDHVWLEMFTIPDDRFRRNAEILLKEADENDARNAAGLRPEWR